MLAIVRSLLPPSVVPFRLRAALVSAALATMAPLTAASAQDALPQLDPMLLQPVKFSYKVSRGDATLGDGTISLQHDERPDCYLYSQIAKPTSTWVKLLSSDVVEQSWFCVQNGHPVPTAFRYHREGFGSSKENFALTFDWTKMQVTNEAGKSFALEDNVIDRLLIQLVLRNWLIQSVNETGRLPIGEERTVHYADDDKVDSYRFAIKAQETTTVPAGTFATVRIDRTDSTNRRSQFWVSPSLNYAVVKAEQQKRDDPVIRLELTRTPEMTGPPADVAHETQASEAQQQALAPAQPDIEPGDAEATVQP